MRAITIAMIAILAGCNSPVRHGDMPADLYVATDASIAPDLRTDSIDLEYTADLTTHPTCFLASLTSADLSDPDARDGVGQKLVWMDHGPRIDWHIDTPPSGLTMPNSFQLVAHVVVRARPGRACQNILLTQIDWDVETNAVNGEWHLFTTWPVDPQNLPPRHSHNGMFPTGNPKVQRVYGNLNAVTMTKAGESHEFWLVMDTSHAVPGSGFLRLTPTALQWSSASDPLTQYRGWNCADQPLQTIEFTY